MATEPSMRPWKQATLSRNTVQAPHQVAIHAKVEAIITSVRFTPLIPYPMQLMTVQGTKKTD